MQHRNDQSDQPEIMDEEIIRLAYSMSIGPYHFIELFKALLARLESTRTARKPAQSTCDDFNRLEPHFENALSLIESRGRQFDSFASADRALEVDSRPAALIDKFGIIVKTNSAAKAAFEFKKHQPLSNRLLTECDFICLMKHLDQLDEYDVDKVIGVFDFLPLNRFQPTKVALTKTLDAEGEAVGYLTGLNVSWSLEIGRQFQLALGLTNAEVEITKAVVTGENMKNLAVRRNRSVNTIRTQLKSLLTKLMLHSQSELACLYSGFAQINRKKETISNLNSSSDLLERKTSILSLENGRVMDYEIVGDEEGRPVIFLPSLLGGNTITKAMRHQIRALNIKLISRP